LQVIKGFSVNCFSSTGIVPLFPVKPSFNVVGSVNNPSYHLTRPLTSPSSQLSTVSTV
jgi:hypothetical protein